MAGQAFVTWRGLKAHGEVQAVLQHGIQPSKFQIQVAPDPDLDLGGTFTINQDGERIQFPDCRADFVDAYRRESDGLLLWTIVVLDRRWKWLAAGNVLYGYYNVRDGKSVRQGTEKNIRELMKLCLDAMGEKGYDLSQVPTDNFPEIEWDYVLPATALDNLAQSINYRVVYQPRRNRTAILPDGEGATLFQGNAVEYSITFNPPEQPDELRFIGNRVLWEMDLELEAVAQDTNLSWQLLNNVSYTPDTFGINFINNPTIRGKNYWWNYDVFLNNIDDDTGVITPEGSQSLREFARSQVYRRYRVKIPPGGLKVQGFGIVKTLDQLLPLLNQRIAETDPAVGVVSRPKPSVLWGCFHHGEVIPLNNTLSVGGMLRQQQFDGTPAKGLTYTKGWRLDVNTGIIETNEPLYLFGIYPGGMFVDGKRIEITVFEPARVFLRTSFGVREQKTRAWSRYFIPRKMSGRKFNTKPHFVKRDDAQLTYNVTSRRTINNFREYEKQANFYLDEQERQYQISTPMVVQYPLIRSIDPDGALQQITWTINERGASTRVSRNREEKMIGLTYEEQRRNQQLSERLKQDDTSRAASDKLRKRPA